MNASAVQWPRGSFIRDYQRVGMASKQSEQLVTYYKSVIGARLAVNPEMPLDEMRAMFEHMGDVNRGEPGGVDYIETDAGGVAGASGRCRRAALRTGCCCARMAAVTSPDRCSRIARCMDTSPRRSAAAR